MTGPLPAVPRTMRAMADPTLTADERTETGSGAAGRLRRRGLLPAVVYGLGAEAVHVTVPAHELSLLLAAPGGVNTPITLRLAGGEVLTLARQVQRHPTRGDLVHVDFVRVDRDVAVSAEVQLQIVGDAPGVGMGGRLEQALFSISVTAKPQAIPASVEVDVSHLDGGDALHVRDLPLPPGVEATADPDELVVQVAMPRGTAGAEEGAEEAGEAGGGEAAAEAAASDGEG